MYLNTPTPFCRVNLFCLPGPGAPPSGVNCESKYIEKGFTVNCESKDIEKGFTVMNLILLEKVIFL